MIKSVVYPNHVLSGIHPLKRDYPKNENLSIFGSDTETCEGRAISVQIAGPDDELFSYTSPEEIFGMFWRWIRGRCREKGVNICYFHNLSFDMRVLFWKWQKKMYEGNSDIHFPITEPGIDVECSMLFGKVFKADLYERDVHLQIFDSKLFTQTSFQKSLKMFGIPMDKFKEPIGLGHLDFGRLPKSDPRRQSFESYAVQDARAERALGLKIMEFHEHFCIAPSLSLPSYSARVFRRHFMHMDDHIPFPPLEVAKASECSYHGGKNGYYLDGWRVVEDLYEVDINSAYPYAMRMLPGITKGRFVRVDGFAEEHLGVYCISGRTRKDGPHGPYPLVFDHGFKPLWGEFRDVWTTGFEVKRMLEVSGNVELDAIWGYAWIPAPGSANPFARFVDHFYGEKERREKSDPYYQLFKILLNALYGKTGSTIEVKSPEAEATLKKLREEGVDIPACVRIDSRFDPVLKRFVDMVQHWRAGSLYNPFIASQITAHARGYLYDLERRNSSVHSSTDSIKTAKFVEPVHGLGGLKVECFGRCYLFRNKLYLHFSKGYDFCHHDKTHGGAPYKYPANTIDKKPHPKAGLPLLDDDGQHLCKVGMHGYKGPLWYLFEHRHELMSKGRLAYKYVHVVGLREGLRRGQTPCNFITIPETLDLHKAAHQDDIIKFLRKLGGIHSREKVPSHWRRCRITSDEGISLDTARASAVDSGYLKEGATEDDLIRAVGRTINGGPVYPGRPEAGEFDPGRDE